jgi:hypothetical protein
MWRSVFGVLAAAVVIVLMLLSAFVGRVAMTTNMIDAVERGGAEFVSNESDGSNSGAPAEGTACVEIEAEDDDGTGVDSEGDADELAASTKDDDALSADLWTGEVILGAGGRSIPRATGTVEVVRRPPRSRTRA